LLSCILSITEYFNKWACTYVGIHCQDYTTSGKAALELFAHRGSSCIITNTLADGVMWLMILAICLLTGLLGWAYGNVDDDVFTVIGVDADWDEIAGFTIACLIGFLLSNILMNVVSSAVNTVIICSAEAPQVDRRLARLVARHIEYVGAGVPIRAQRRIW
jgi:hypothetical protein